MTRGILIAGNESAIINAIETEAARRAGHYALARIPDRFTGDIQPSTDTASSARVLLDWNPGSPISARTLVLAAENRLEQVSEAVLVCDPPSVRTADFSLADIEVLVNDHIKGWFFLVKELTAIFRARGEGTLALVYPETGGGKDDELMGSAALAVFRSFTRNILAAALNEPYMTQGFSCAEAGDEAGFAAFIFKQLDEGNRRGNGKLHKYGKLGIFR